MNVPLESMVITAVGAVISALVLVVGWLLNRAIGGIDTKLDEMSKKLESTAEKVNGHSEKLAVHDFRISKLEEGK